MASELEQIKHLSEHYKSNYQPDLEAGWAKLHGRIEATKASEAARLRVVATRQWLSAAAAILLLGIAAFWVLLPSTKSETLATNALEQRKIQMSDGSTVVLNQNSRLTYPSSFETSNRRAVQLSGEAFFAVQLNAKKPFVIAAGAAEIKVLGTAFNVRAYPQEATIEVEVTEGRVLFAVQNASLELKAGERGIFEISTNRLYRRHSPNLNAQAWRTGQLSFVKTPLAETIRELERYYHVKIELADAANGKCAFTGNFENTELSEAMNAISTALGLNLQQPEPKRYMLSGQGCR